MLARFAIAALLIMALRAPVHAADPAQTTGVAVIAASAPVDRSDAEDASSLDASVASEDQAGRDMAVADAIGGAENQPVKKRRAARVTTCRCGADGQ